MTSDAHETAAQPRTLWQATVWHAPGFIVGLYFLSLHFLSTLNLSYLILLVGAVFLLSTQPVLAWRKLLGAPTALALALFVSTLLSIHNAAERIDTNLGVAQIPGLLIYAIVVLCVRSPRQLLGLVLGFCIALPAMLWVFAAASLHSGFSRAVQLIYHGAQPLFLAANDMLMYVVFMPLVVWFALREWRGRPGVLLAGAYIAVLALLAVLLLSRLSLLLIAVFGLFYFGSGRQRLFWYGALALGLAIAALLLFDASFMEKVRRLDMARLRTWIAALAMFADAPWLGNGPGSFSLLYPAYLRDMPESIRFGREIRDIGWAHSLFFEAAAEKGLLGLAVTIAYFVYLFAAPGARLRSGGGEFFKALRATALICLVAAIFELSMLRAWGIYAIYLLLALVAAFAAAPGVDGDEAGAA
jgi:O-antigen ligase